MRWFRGCSWLHLSGYSLLRAPIDEAGAKAAGAVRAVGRKVSVDLASASLHCRRMAQSACSSGSSCSRPIVVFANEDEVDGDGGSRPAGTLVRKRGPRGIHRRRRGITPRADARSSTRREPAMRSRPGTSSAARGSRARPPRAAWPELGAMP